MGLVMSICIGSAIQVALVVAPLLVILSWLLGSPMTLVFEDPLDLFAIAGTAFIVNAIAGDGETTWFEGMLLIGVYAVLRPRVLLRLTGDYADAVPAQMTRALAGGAAIAAPRRPGRPTSGRGGGRSRGSVSAHGGEGAVALPQVCEVGRVRDVAVGVVQHQVGVALQRPAGRVTLAAGNRDQHLQQADQHGGAAGGVLPDEVEHGVGQTRHSDAGHHQHGTAVGARTPFAECAALQSHSAAPSRSSTLIAVCGSLMPGDSARTATSTSWRTANSRSAELTRCAPERGGVADRGVGPDHGRDVSAMAAPGNT